jgi:hypothetical protein
MKAILLATAATLAFGGELASAAYAPRLLVTHEPGAVEVTFRQTLADDATGVLLFYVPEPYTTIVGQAPGTTIGQVSAQVEARAVAPGAVIPLAGGTIVTDDPGVHVSNTCAPGMHLAVWLFVLPVPNQAEPLRIPVYIDFTTGAPDAPLGAARLKACLPTPNVPESAGGARLGTKLLEAKLWLTNVRPQGAGERRWTGLFTPHAATGLVPNASGTVEARAMAGGPGAVTLRGKRITSRVRGTLRQFAQLRGAVTQSGRGIGDATVRITGGGATRTTRTKSGGAFSLIVALGRTTTFRASTSVPDRDVTTAVCPPCVSASASGFSASSRRVNVSPPRLKPKRP